MAQISNAYSTRDARGNREDLSNTIYNIDPTDTPFMSRMTGTRDATNTVFDWQTENLQAMDTDNAAEEGFEAERQRSQPTERPSNVVQISTKNATVTGTQQAANAAGKSSEMGHQMAMRSRELKRDMEGISLSDQAKNDGSDGSIRRTRAMGNWLRTNVLFGEGGSAAPSNGASRPTSGTARQFSEAHIKEVMQSCYRNGADPRYIMVGPYNKGVFSTFRGRENSTQDIDRERVQATVTLYASDFGNLTVVPNRWQPEDRAYFLDPQYVKMAYYRRFRTEPLAKQGDAQTKMIVVEWGVECSNEAAHGAVRDLTTQAGASGGSS